MPIIDHLREPLSVGWEHTTPDSSWPRVLIHAVDDVVRALWLLRAGLTVPAAIQARTVLERWTFNVAHTHGLNQLAGETDEHYISRVWQVYGHRDIPREVGPWWATLSEVVHGRDTAGRLGTHILSSAPCSPNQTTDLHDGICAVLELCMRQIRGGLSIV